MKFIYHLRLNKGKEGLGLLGQEANYGKLRGGDVW